MSVITISKEFGSNGNMIAEEVAQKLGYALVNKQTIGKILSQYGLLDFKQLYDSVPDFWDGFDYSKMEERKVTIDMMNRVIMAIAKRGNAVIVGRGSYIVLSGYLDVLSIRIQAPLSARVKFLMETDKINDMVKAEAMVKEHDKLQRLFLEAASGEHKVRASDFDLVFNTGKVAPSLVVAWIVAAETAMATSNPTGAGTVQACNVDPVLAGAVAKALEAS